MEKAARRTHVKTLEASSTGAKAASRLPSLRGTSRERAYCRRVGFLLVFSLFTLFSYYVAVVRLHPPIQGDYISKLSIFAHSKHLAQQRSGDGAQETSETPPFLLTSADWSAGDFTNWFFRRRSESGSKVDLLKSAEKQQDGDGGGSRNEGASENGNLWQGAGKLEAGDNELRLQGREMESESERGLSESAERSEREETGSKADPLGTAAANKNVSARDGAPSADPALTSAPLLLRGAGRNESSPVLKRVVAELQKQAEANKVLAEADKLSAETDRLSANAISSGEGTSTDGDESRSAAEEGTGDAVKDDDESEESEGGAEAKAGAAKPRKKKGKKFNSSPDIWNPISDEGFHQCVERGADWSVPPAVEGRGYFYPGLDGGLSQQIFEIANSVAVARILNVTLVIPQLGFDPYWKDGSNFSTIFDLDHFRRTLADDIRVVTISELPEEMRNEYYWRIIDRIPYGREDQYVSEFNDSFSTDKVTKSYSFFTALDIYLRPALEKLRCRAKYQALKFHPQIVSTAQRLVARMREKAKGPFLALHLRFETDMVMYSARCEYGINDPEEIEYWDAQRAERGWPEPEPDDVMRGQGRCPATPGEVGRWLQAMGFNESTQVYLASGAIYHEDVFMPDFMDMFPNTVRKEDIFTPEEAALLKGKNNILAGIDFEVLANADVTALTFHGMMKSSIAGHRNWLGFKRTLTYPLWESARLRTLPWKEFKTLAKKATIYGQPMQRSGVEVMGNPVPECMCQEQQTNAQRRM